MSIDEFLKQASSNLKRAGILTSRLDSLLLMEAVISEDRAWILSHLDESLTPLQSQKINKLLELRLKHIPMAYILGEVEFYGRNFVVNNHVLVPRPETETMIDMLKELVANTPAVFAGKENIRIGDIGTGSGAIGITAALEIPNVLIDLVDIDRDALKVAQINVDKYTLNIKTIGSNLLSNLKDDYYLLLCNLPYVPDGYTINKAATYEPSRAIFGGQDGLSIYRDLFKQLSIRQNKPLYLLCEAFSTQHTELASIARLSGYKTVRNKDFIVLFKLQ